MENGFIKVASATPKIRLADCEYNARQIIALMEQAAAQKVKVICFPELCITGYTCGDLFLHDTLIQGAEHGLRTILEATEALDLVAAVGLPVQCNNKLYNCAAVICHGELLGLVPKSYLPNYGEFYEQRWFTSGRELPYTICSFAGQDDVELSTNLVFRWSENPLLTIGVEICEDLWVSDTPSTRLCAGGATILLNPSASDETVGKADWRRTLLTCTSKRLACAYIYANPGWGESTGDSVFAGHDVIAENGTILSEQIFTTGLLITEVDIQGLAYERRRMSTYPASGEVYSVYFDLEKEETQLTRTIPSNPFIPVVDTDRRYADMLLLSAQGLAQRLEHTHANTAVIGLSGGLDSTLALLVTQRAFQMLGRDAKDILAVTMPCFGTTDRTKNNACILAEELGATLMEVDIGASVNLHFRDIGHDPDNHDVTYENAQARERTQVLMDLANQRNGLVIGTGDLSELALGWCTYNGDHMSMYAVNASIPKTLVRCLVRFAAQQADNQTLAHVLEDILDTPVSPELLPAVEGEISQKTEDLVGPYELHDFFLFYMLRWGFGPKKIYRLAVYALGDSFSPEVILKWLKRFYHRFFTQQFKRSCMPDGPKVGSVGLSPRGDWRMPSDVCGALWLKEVDSL